MVRLRVLFLLRDGHRARAHASGRPDRGAAETFGVFAVVPAVGAFWGHMGDRKVEVGAGHLHPHDVGGHLRDRALPTFEAVGILAPILLLCLRMVQSFSASGEYAGAATFLAEYAPSNHRGLYCSLVPASTATACSSLRARHVHVHDVGPRLVLRDRVGLAHPVPSGGSLGLITHYIRTRVSTTRRCTRRCRRNWRRRASPTTNPSSFLLTKHLRRFAGVLRRLHAERCASTPCSPTCPTICRTPWATTPVSSSLITTICLVAYIGFIFVSGRISDKVGRKKMLIIACVGFIVFTVPAFYLLNSQNFAIILIVESSCAFCSPSTTSALELPVETFPTEVRYSGFALSFNFANAIFGGSASFISIALIARRRATPSRRPGTWWPSPWSRSSPLHDSTTQEEADRDQ